jgi:protein-L-isoaspartate(D-aspartate) O-methyltransferase
LRSIEIGQVRGEINIGQLYRQRFAEAAVLVGFGTDRGTVAAASDWDGPMEIKQVRPPTPTATSAFAAIAVSIGSWASVELHGGLLYPRLERAIGVHLSAGGGARHYFDASLPRQFDA